MQLVIFLPTFNAPCMRRKIRCDGWKRKYFELAWEVNQALVAPACTQVKFKSPWPPRTASKHNKLPFPLPLAFRPPPCMSMSSMSLSMHEASLTSHTATVHALPASPTAAAAAATVWCACARRFPPMAFENVVDDDVRRRRGGPQPWAPPGSSSRSGVFRGRRAGKGR
jgi:hypothetical protein